MADKQDASGELWVPENIMPDSVRDVCTQFCGCGAPEVAWGWVRTYLSSVKEQTYRMKDVQDGAEWVAVYLMSRLDLTSHGVSVCNSWMTEKGEEVLAFLEKHGVDFLDTRSWADSEGVVWSYIPDADGNQ